MKLSYLKQNTIFTKIIKPCDNLNETKCVKVSLECFLLHSETDKTIKIWTDMKSTQAFTWMLGENSC